MVVIVVGISNYNCVIWILDLFFMYSAAGLLPAGYILDSMYTSSGKVEIFFALACSRSLCISTSAWSTAVNFWASTVYERNVFACCLSGWSLERIVIFQVGIVIFLPGTTSFSSGTVCNSAKHRVEADPKFKSWKNLDDAIREIHNHNASGLSFEELYRLKTLVQAAYPHLA